MSTPFELAFVEAKSMGPRTRHLVFKYHNGEPMAFTAGQFISFDFEKEGKVHKRNYSIANSPDQKDCMEVAYAHIEGGLASTAFDNLKPGDVLQASGPYGIFVLKDEQPKRYILMATGTGVTPYRSMLKALGERLTATDLKVLLLFGVRGPKELLYGDEFIQMAKDFPNFEFRACYSRVQPENPESYEYSGHAQKQLDSITIDAEKDIVYLCGNPGMVDEAFAKLTELGMDRKNVRREKYVAGR